ncbi:ABC transporter permease [Actinotalea sp. BY-33]|uniref:ABC transporter permease n=1 Tax=Actinotalea soli TaxID=2819234 RepID=A0A939LS52_9CELL|nr:ABC transporter permease [Actinotalea soli]MBO1753119.1 ABC transporter permease [Actinotalea soli]
MSGWTTVRVVAAREITVKLRDKAFLGSTLFLLLLVIAATVIPVLISNQTPSIRVAVQGQAAAEVVERAAELGAEAQQPDADLPPALLMLGAPGLPAADVTAVEVEPEGDAAALVESGDVAAALLGERITDLRLVGSEAVPVELEALVRAAANEVQVAGAAAEAGLSAAEVRSLTTPATPEVVLLDAQPASVVPPQLLVLLFAFLFYLSVLTFGMSIAQSVVEEKQSRVVELLVAAVPVRWLLAGKVLGNTLMAVGQIVVILGAGLLAATLAGQGRLVEVVLGASGWFVLFFLLGFTMLACLWAAAGALASRVEDLNSTTIFMQVLVIAPFFAAIFAIDPGPTQRVLSYVPFTAPLLMPARVVLDNAEPWEPVVAALVVLGTAGLFVVLGTRLYERSVLHTASRLTARDAWRRGLR